MRSCMRVQRVAAANMFANKCFACARSLAPPAAQTSSRRRRSRHQHFWRNADKMPEQHRLFVESSDVAEALERGAPVTHVQVRVLGPLYSRTLGSARRTVRASPSLLQAQMLLMLRSLQLSDESTGL